MSARLTFICEGQPGFILLIPYARSEVIETRCRSPPFSFLVSAKKLNGGITLQEKYGRYKSQTDHYEIFICNSDSTEKYYITFKDVNGLHHEVEITEDVYFEFLKSFRVMKNHDWRAWYNGTISGLHENMEAIAPGPSLEEIIIEREFKGAVDKIIASLSAKQRRRFRLYYEYGFTYSEIARKEGCTLMAAKSSILKAETKVKSIFDRHNY